MKSTRALQCKRWGVKSLGRTRNRRRMLGRRALLIVEFRTGRNTNAYEVKQSPSPGGYLHVHDNIELISRLRSTDVNFPRTAYDEARPFAGEVI